MKHHNFFHTPPLANNCELQFCHLICHFDYPWCSPRLFLAYINDLPSKVKFIACPFVNHCLAYRSIRSDEDTRQEHDWQMAFNLDKCEVIRISTKRHPIITTYSIHGTPLRTTEYTTNLGLIISNKLSWKENIDNATKTANSTMSFIRWNIRSRRWMSKQRYSTHIMLVHDWITSHLFAHPERHIPN